MRFAFFHIADNNTPIRFNAPTDLIETLDEVKANAVFLVEIKGNVQQSAITFIPDKIKSENYPVRLSRDNEASTALLNEINQRWNNAESLHFNAYKQRRSSNPKIHFMLPSATPSKI